MNTKWNEGQEYLIKNDAITCYNCGESLQINSKFVYRGLHLSGDTGKFFMLLEPSDEIQCSGCGELVGQMQLWFDNDLNKFTVMPQAEFDTLSRIE